MASDWLEKSGTPLLVTMITSWHDNNMRESVGKKNVTCKGAFRESIIFPGLLLSRKIFQLSFTREKLCRKAFIAFDSIFS